VPRGSEVDLNPISVFEASKFTTKIFQFERRVLF
jgi:hypothetical protein